jgi:LPS export ABC transporter permease LptG/LPS export ABC transporter permease LptF
MRLLSRSVLRELASPFLLGFAAYTFLLLVRQIFLMTDFLVRRAATFGEVLWLILLSIPWIVVLTLPMAFLLALLIGIGRFAADSELVAMRSCGVGPAALYRPVFGAAAALSAGVFLLYNFVLPGANDALGHALARLSATSPVNLVQPRVFREIRPGVTLFFDRVGADSQSFDGVFLAFADESRNRIVVARTGRLSLEGNNLWLELEESVAHEFDPADPARYRIDRNQRQRILFAGDIWNSPKAQISFEKGLRSQSLGELLRTAASERPLAGSPERYRLAWVEIHKKLSIPLACFAFAFVGIPLAETSRRGGRGSGFALSLAILIGYYVLLSSGETWAESGKLGPGLAMWLPNSLLVLLGITVFVRRGRERKRLALPFLRGRKTGAAPAPAEAERRARWTGFWRFPAVLDRYVLARFLSALALTLLSILVVALIVDYADKVDEIIRHKPSWSDVSGYYRYFLFNISMDSAPFAVLVASLVGLGVLSRNNEDTAFKAGGVSLHRLGAPVLVAAGVGCLLVFAMGEYVEPVARQREARYVNVIKGRPKDYGMRYASERNWFYGEDGRIWFREETDPGRGVLVAPTVFEFGPSFALVRRDQAREAQWAGRDWAFRGGWTRTFDGSVETSYQPFVERTMQGELPAAFTRERRTPEEMTLRELGQHIRRLERTGYPTESLWTAFHQKISRPVLIPLMALLSIPFAFTIGKRGTLAGIGVGLGLGMIFLVAEMFFTRLGTVGALPPLLAAWSPNILFATGTTYLLLRLRT